MNGFSSTCDIALVASVMGVMSAAPGLAERSGRAADENCIQISPCWLASVTVASSQPRRLQDSTISCAHELHVVLKSLLGVPIAPHLSQMLRKAGYKLPFSCDTISEGAPHSESSLRATREFEGVLLIWEVAAECVSRNTCMG